MLNFALYTKCPKIQNLSQFQNYTVRLPTPICIKYINKKKCSHIAIYRSLIASKVPKILVWIRGLIECLFAVLVSTFSHWIAKSLNFSALNYLIYRKYSRFWSFGRFWVFDKPMKIACLHKSYSVMSQK